MMWSNGGVDRDWSRRYRSSALYPASGSNAWSTYRSPIAQPLGYVSRGWESARAGGRGMYKSGLSDPRDMQHKIDELEHQLSSMKLTSSSLSEKLHRAERIVQDMGHQSRHAALEEQSRHRAEAERLHHEQKRLEWELSGLREELARLRHTNRQISTDNAVLVAEVERERERDSGWESERGTGARTDWGRTLLSGRGRRSYSGEGRKDGWLSDSSVTHGYRSAGSHHGRARSHHSSRSSRSSSSSSSSSSSNSSKGSRKRSKERKHGKHYSKDGRRCSHWLTKGYCTGGGRCVGGAICSSPHPCGSPCTSPRRCGRSLSPHDPSIGYRSVLPHPIVTQHNKSHLYSDLYDLGEAAGRRYTFTPRVMGNIKPGDVVQFNRGGVESEGRVKYLGHLPGKTQPYIGLELLHEYGHHDGVYNGYRYFKCKPSRGVFVPFSQVTRAKRDLI